MNNEIKPPKFEIGQPNNRTIFAAVMFADRPALEITKYGHTWGIALTARKARDLAVWLQKYADWISPLPKKIPTYLGGDE